MKFARLAKWSLVWIGTLAILLYYLIHSDLFMSPAHPLPPMRTYCIGRYLIDLPESFVPADGGSDGTLYYGLDKNFKTVDFEILRQNGDKPTFNALVLKKLNELKTTESFVATSKNMLADYKEIDKHTALVKAYSSPDMANYFDIYLYSEHEKVVVQYQDRLYADAPPHYLSVIENRLLDLARNTHYAPDPNKAGSGICLKSVSIDSPHDGETFDIVFLNTAYPDIHISLWISSLPAHGEGMLKRIDDQAGLLAELGASYKPFRRGDITLGGRPAEEQLDEAKDEHGKLIRNFAAETLITQPSNLERPQIHIEMKMGGQVQSREYVDASLSRSDAEAWWDAIVKSIRPRPGAF
jgi:hypothetical protein